MGKRLIELFKKGDINTFNVQDGNVAAPGGKTMEERYDIKNSKDIKLSSSSTLMNLAFGAVNKLRIGSNERKTETFLEEELIGIRTLRGLASPVLYGTDIIRLKLQSTPVLESMKNDQVTNGNPNTDSLSKFGQKIKSTRDAIANSGLLGLPKPLNPSSWYAELKDSPSYNTMETLSTIKNGRAGSEFGKLLKQSAGGGASAAGKQLIGAGLSKAKSALRNKILGSNAASINGNNNFGRSIFLFSQIEGENYSQLTIGAGKYGKANPNAELKKWSIKSRYDEVSSTNPRFPVITDTNGTGRNSKIWYDTRQENPVDWTYDKQATLYDYTSDATYDGSGIKSNYLEDVAVKGASVVLPPKYDVGKGTFAGDGKIIDVNNLRPTNLKDVKNPTDAPSYSKSKGMRPIGEPSIYGNLGETLEKKRGLGSNKDVLNQTGKFSKGDLNSVKYGGDGIEKMDLIPLRFQKVNDLSAVYFRAVISGFSETFTPTWESSKFLGNPFNFYSFTGIERKVGFTLKVYAMSQPELIMMWRRLEYLAKLTYPHEYISGYGVEPSLFYFTLGSMYVDKPAIITSLTYTIDDNEQLWELGGDTAKIGKDRYESSFDGKFYSGEKNQTSIGKAGGVQNYKSAFTKYTISQNGEMVKDDTINSNSNKPTDTSDFIIETEKINADMEQYKLPKFINAQIEITFLESKNNTVDNLYGYGKTITGGK